MEWLATAMGLLALAATTLMFWWLTIAKRVMAQNAKLLDAGGAMAVSYTRRLYKGKRTSEPKAEELTDNWFLAAEMITEEELAETMERRKKMRSEGKKGRALLLLQGPTGDLTAVLGEFPAGKALGAAISPEAPVGGVKPSESILGQASGLPEASGEVAQ